MHLARIWRSEAGCSWRFPLGYTAETDATGKEKWPVGDEKVWKEGIPGVTAGEYHFIGVCAHFPWIGVLLRASEVEVELWQLFLPSVQEPRAARAVGRADTRTRFCSLALLLFRSSCRRLIATRSRFRYHFHHQVRRKPCPHLPCTPGVQPGQLRCLPSVCALRSRQPSRTSHLHGFIRVYILILFLPMSRHR